MNIVKFIVRTYINVLRSDEAIPWNCLTRMGEHNIENDDEEALQFARAIVAERRDGADDKAFLNDWNGVPKSVSNKLAMEMEEFINDGIDDEDHYNLEFISSLFGATEVERRALNVALYMRHKLRNGNRISSFLDRVLPGFAASDFEVQRLAHGFSQSEIEDIKTGSLFTSYVLVGSPGDEYFQLSDYLGDIFQVQNLDVEFLKKKLFNSDIISHLDIESFSHLEKDISITESIINGALEKKTLGTNIFLWGEPGTGKTELPFVLSKRNNWHVIAVGDTSSANESEKNRNDRIANLRLAQKIFSKNDRVVLLFDEFEDIANMDRKNSKAFINRILETTEIPIFWTTNTVHNVDKASLRRMTFNIKFELPNSEIRKKIWRKYANQYDIALENDYIEKISEAHEMSPSLIHNAMKIISSPNIDRDNIPHIIESINTLVNYGVNPNKLNYKKHASETYSTRFVNSDVDTEKLSGQILKAKGKFSLCMYGPPGTGKSEYGKFLANKLGKKILYKRVSDLGSPYINETEIKIAAAFKQAADEDKILMIDEGDSFLRDRNLAVRSYEVSQVNEMLSQMEMLSCDFILTTNLMDNLDMAALRRFTFKIKFDYLNKDQGREIFKHYFGVEAPESIRNLEKMTPGDFAGIKSRAEIMDVTDPEELLEMIREECRLKDPHKQNRIGF